MKKVQFIQLVGLTPEENNKPIFDYIDKKFEDFKIHFQPKEDDYLMSRQEVADFFKIDLSTLYLWTKKGKLKSVGVSGRVYYRRSEVEKSLVELQ